MPDEIGRIGEPLEAALGDRARRPVRSRRAGRGPRPRNPAAFGSPSTWNGSYALPSQPPSWPGALPPGAAGCMTVQGIVTALGIAPGVGRSFDDERTQVRPVARRRAGGVGIGRRGKVAGQDAVRRREVRGVVVAHRPHDRQPVRLLRQQREVLADRDARHARRDRPKRPRISVGSVGLRVPGVELARPAPHEDQDARLRPAKPAVRRILVRPLAPAAGPANPGPSAPARPPATSHAAKSEADGSRGRPSYSSRFGPRIIGYPQPFGAFRANLTRMFNF